jgi:hypothetical protein
MMIKAPTETPKTQSQQHGQTEHEQIIKVRLATLMPVQPPLRKKATESACGERHR